MPTIAWLFEGSALPSTPDIVIYTSNSSSVLTIIAAVTENDYGNYSCIATNMFGSSTATIEVYSGEISSELVKVKDVPSLIPVSFHFVIVLYYVFISCCHGNSN